MVVTWKHMAIEKNLNTETDQKYIPPVTPTFFLRFFLRDPQVLMNPQTVQGKSIKNPGETILIQEAMGSQTEGKSETKNRREPFK